MSCENCKSMLLQVESFRKALKLIASCEKRTDGDVVDIAQKALAGTSVNRQHDFRWDPCSTGGLLICKKCEAAYCVPPWSKEDAMKDECKPKSDKRDEDSPGITARVCLKCEKPKHEGDCAGNRVEEKPLMCLWCDRSERAVGYGICQKCLDTRPVVLPSKDVEKRVGLSEVPLGCLHLTVKEDFGARTCAACGQPLMR